MIDSVAELLDNFNGAGHARMPRGVMVRALPVKWLIPPKALAILAFSLTVGYSVTTKFSVACPQSQMTRTVHFQYPFNIHEDSMIELPLCPKNKSTPKPTKFLYGDYSHHSQFFVFIGVTNMIYVLVVLLVYICLPDWYNQEQTPKWISSLVLSSTDESILEMKFAVQDFAVMAFWTVAWFIASVVWAAGQSKLIQYTSPHRIFIELAREGCQADKCKSLGAPGFGTLAFSALFGFLSSCLSGVTMWFLWKETSWARSRQYTSDLNDHTADGSPF